MAKTASKDFIGFSTWETKDYIRECANIVRWNPRLAISWMNAIRGDVISDTMVNSYNDTVKYINKFLDDLETYRYYDKYETWENDKPSRLEQIKFEF